MSKLKPGGYHRHFLEVEGSGTFPVDMLRYECCVPATESDANSIQHHEEKRVVKLFRFTPTSSLMDGPATRTGRERWASFGWRVLPIREGFDR